MARVLTLSFVALDVPPRERRPEPDSHVLYLGRAERAICHDATTKLLGLDAGNDEPHIVVWSKLFVVDGTGSVSGMLRGPFLSRLLTLTVFCAGVDLL